MMPPLDPHYRHRFPAEIITHAVWLYHVFSLSLRDVELILAKRGIVVSYETVRRWCKKFAATFANRLRRRRPRPGDKWHMDEGVPLLVAPLRDEEYAPEFTDLPEIPRPPTGHFLRDGEAIAVATAIRQRFDLGLDIGNFRRAPVVLDDEAWYYDPERPKKPVESHDLQCRRFRHGNEPEPFEVLIFPQAQEVVVRDALEVEVSASNVGRSLTLTFPLDVTTTFQSSMQTIESFLADQDPVQRATRGGPFSF
jgi:hypothetical protein